MNFYVLKYRKRSGLAWPAWCPRHLLGCAYFRHAKYNKCEMILGRNNRYGETDFDRDRREVDTRTQARHRTR